MGGSISTNTIQSMIDNSIKVINNFEQTCTDGIKEQNVVLKLNKCKIGGDVKVVESSQIDQNCILNASNQSSIKSSVSQAMRQSAEAIHLHVF